MPTPANASNTYKQQIGTIAGVLNVRNYGATGNGTDDDYEAIQAVIDAAAQRTVFIPAGTYRINTALSIPSNVTIVGDNRSFGTQIYPNGCEAFHIYKTVSTKADTQIFNIRISNLLINGTNASGSYLIDSENNYRITIENVHIWTPNGLGGVRTKDSNLVLYKDMVLAEGAGSGGYAFYFTGTCASTIIENCNMQDPFTRAVYTDSALLKLSFIDVINAYTEGFSVAFEHAGGRMRISGGYHALWSNQTFAWIRSDDIAILHPNLYTYSVARQNSTAYSVGDVITSGTNKNRYLCVGAGTSDSSPPTFPDFQGAVITDNDVVWRCVPPMVGKAGKIDFYADGDIRTNVTITGVPDDQITFHGQPSKGISEYRRGIQDFVWYHSKFIPDNSSTGLFDIDLVYGRATNPISIFELTIFSTKAGYASAVGKYRFAATMQSTNANIVDSLTAIYTYSESDSANYVIDTYTPSLSPSGATITVNMLVDVSGASAAGTDTDVHAELKCLTNTTGIRVDRL